MLKFKMKIYCYNEIHDLDVGLKETYYIINNRLTISHLDDAKWYVFINIHITILEIYMNNLIIANWNILHPNMHS